MSSQQSSQQPDTENEPPVQRSQQPDAENEPTSPVQGSQQPDIEKENEPPSSIQSSSVVLRKRRADRSGTEEPETRRKKVLI